MSYRLIERWLKRAFCSLGYVLLKSEDGQADEGFAISAGSGTPTTGTYGGQTLATGQNGLALDADSADYDAAVFVTLDGGITHKAIKLMASAWYTGSVTPAADSVDGVHAGVAASAANAFPGPITAPDVPRALQCVFGVGWDGGNVTVTGTDQFDAALTEAFTSPGAGGGTVTGSKAFKTVTAIAKATVGASGATCSVGRYHLFGATKAITAVGGLVTCDDANETAVWGRTYSTFSPTTLPNGSHVYRWAVIG